MLEFNGRREGDIGGLELRGTTRSHQTTELKWVLMWGGAEAASELEQKERE